MNTTTTGCMRSGMFFRNAQEAEDPIKSDVWNLASDQNWQGIVNYAKSYVGWDYSKKPFTADDAEVTIDKWTIVALDDDNSVDEKIRGAILVVRPFSKRGFVIRKQGGIAYLTSGRAISTRSASLHNIGNLPSSSETLKSFPGKLETKWKFDETSSGALGFFYNNSCRFALYPGGGGWTKQHPELKTVQGGSEADGEYFVPAASGESSIGDSILAFEIISTTNWTVRQTINGNLQWIKHPNPDDPGVNNNTIKLVTRRDNGKLKSNSTPKGILADQENPDLWDALQNMIEYAGEELAELAEESWEYLTDLAVSTWDWAEGAVDDSIDWIEDAAEDVVDEVVDVAESVVDEISGWFGW